MAVWDPKNTLDEIGLGREGYKRAERVADVIKNELSILLISKVRDPNLDNVSISRVTVSDDLKNAKIFYTLLPGEKKRLGQAKKGLERAKGFMRSHLAKMLNMRYTPALQFYYDDAADKAREIEDIFQEIANERRRGEENS